jgi:tripartite-type tricarboxylate transporter receptor subunit TctC
VEARSQFSMTQAVVQLKIPFDLLVAAIMDLPSEDKIRLKQILANPEADDAAVQSSIAQPNKDPERVKQAVERLNQAIQQASSEMGITEDEFGDLFDLSGIHPVFS